MQAHPDDVQFILDLLWQASRGVDDAMIHRAIFMLSRGKGIGVIARHIDRTSRQIAADPALQPWPALQALANDFASACREAVAVHVPR